MRDHQRELALGVVTACVITIVALLVPEPVVTKIVRLLNRLPTLDLGGGDYSSCPEADLRVFTCLCADDTPVADQADPIKAARRDAPLRLAQASARWSRAVTLPQPVARRHTCSHVFGRINPWSKIVKNLSLRPYEHST
jgi:hypothetical protein